MLAFRLGPCRVRLDFSFFALTAFCCIFMGAEGGLACFLGVCVHEAAHLAAMWALEVYPGSITLSALGCRIEMPCKPAASDVQNVWISLAGPAANWLIAALSAALGQRDSSFFAANLALACAHSLPIEPLDGGLALRYFLRGICRDDMAERISRIVSALFLVPLATLGFLVLLNTRYNYSLLALAVYLMLYLVLKWDLSAP